MPEKIPQPTIKVVMPSTVLRLEHITYLRNLATGDKKIKCELSCSQVSRLKLLGLIEEYEIPPNPVEVRKHKEACEKTIESMRRLADKEDWDGLAHMDTYIMLRTAPRPIKANRVTEAALELLKKSEVKVKLQKGCA